MFWNESREPCFILVYFKSAYNFHRCGFWFRNWTTEKIFAEEIALKFIGKDRNSCSKTDLEETFMQMKEDHMRNGRLKSAYNV